VSRLVIAFIVLSHQDFSHIRLGFLFRAQPTLMTMERSASIMDQIFASPEEEGKGRLLKIIQDFLMSEAEKHTALEKGTQNIS